MTRSQTSVGSSGTRVEGDVESGGDGMNDQLEANCTAVRKRMVSGLVSDLLTLGGGRIFAEGCRAVKQSKLRAAG